MKPPYLRKAVRHLKESDPTLAAVIERVGPCRLELRTEGTHFHALLRSILYQQLSGQAARTIHERLQGIWGGRDPEPAELLAVDEAAMRAAGVSGPKIRYLRDLAAHVESGALELERIDTLEDEAIVEHLTRVKGVGVWTVQMFLLFRLGRPDVLPCADLGVQKAIRQAWDLPALPRPAEVAAMGEAWRPYASAASWYLWRSLEIVTPGGT